MSIRMPYLTPVLAAATLACACADMPTAVSGAGPSAHVGYKGTDLPLGFVENDAECHIGKKGNRWPASEQYEVKVYSAQLLTTPSSVMVLVCSGDIPADQPRPEQAEVYEDVLCFLPNGISTRHANEVFTPGGGIILTCQYNPNQS